MLSKGYRTQIPVTRSIQLPQSSQHLRLRRLHRAMPARVRRPRLHAVLQPAHAVLLRHRHEDLRGGLYGAAAADCEVITDTDLRRLIRRFSSKKN